MVDLNLPILVGAAVIDSINPCAFGVLIFLLAYLSARAKTRAHMFAHGMVYILAVFLTYFAAGILLLPIIQEFGSFSVWSYILIALAILFAGLLEIKDYFWYGRGWSLHIAPKEAERIKMYVQRIANNYSTSFWLGVFVALVELPCTGAVYLAVLSLMSLGGVDGTHIAWLVLYNIIFVLPLIIILWLVCNGTSTTQFEAWRQRHKGLMRLLTGVTLVLLSAWMVWTVWPK